MQRQATACNAINPFAIIHQALTHWQKRLDEDLLKANLKNVKVSLAPSAKQFRSLSLASRTVSSALQLEDELRQVQQAAAAKHSDGSSGR